MEVRAATPEDFEAMLDMGAKMHAEGRFSSWPYDREWTRQNGTALFESGNGFLAVAHDGPDYVGMVIAQAVVMLFCQAACIQDWLIWVEPSRRGSVAAVGLLEALEVWAARYKKSGLPVGINLGVWNGVEPERVGKFYESRGYVNVGGLYSKRI